MKTLIGILAVLVLAHPLLAVGIIGGELAALVALAVVIARAAGWRPPSLHTRRT